MDIWDKKKRSEVMSKIRSKNTKPEIALRKALFTKGYRYRINYKKLPGKPDIVFPKYKTVIFVHGCFWHGHEGCKDFSLPKTNTEFWNTKIAGNQQRDNHVKMQLIESGWNVITVWECETEKKSMESTMQRIETLLTGHEKSTQVKIYELMDGEVVKVAEEIVPYNRSVTASPCLHSASD
jgi:DNA mismatch endonuclease (patch repair protein)